MASTCSKTLAPGSSFITEPHAPGAAERFKDLAFADVIHQTFMCTADGRTVEAGRTSWYGANNVGDFPP